ncbi:hypothetical protein CRYUN_Cryun37aG0122300 [Craigia yunnanensis]
MNRQDTEWCVSMPKVELHAHLNGSVRNSTLLELARVLGEKGIILLSDVENVIMRTQVVRPGGVWDWKFLVDLIFSTKVTVVYMKCSSCSTSSTFSLLIIPTVTRNTKERNDSIGMSKHSYMEAVMEGLRAVNSVDVDYALPVLKTNTFNGTTRKKIYVRFLLSIDRRESNEAAMETVKLAVVSIDLSGNPIVGNWYSFANNSFLFFMFI